MKRTILAFTGFVAALSLLWVGVVQAMDVRSGTTARVESNEVIDGTLYAAGQDVKVFGLVKGDVMCAGQNIEISGTVEGDVLCAGQIVTVGGTVKGDIRAAGQNVILQGKVDGSATVAGMSIDTKSTSIIGRDLTAMGQTVTLAGVVNRDVVAGGDSFTSSAGIYRNLNVEAQNVSLLTGSMVGGNLVYTSNNNAIVNNGALVSGTTDHKYPEQKQKAQVNTAAVYAMSLVFSFVGYLVVGAVLLLVSPRIMSAVPATIKKSPLGTFGLGFVGMVVPPMVSLLFFITIVGIPVGIILFLIWIISLMTAAVFTAKLIGEYIVEKLKWTDGLRDFGALILGLLVLFLVGLVPFIGGIVMFVAVVWGIGAQWYAIGQSRRQNNIMATKESKKTK